MSNKICLKCGYGWDSRKDNPKSCPDCKSRRWYEPKRESTPEGDINGNSGSIKE
jgi:predicted Zn-ribbon and HTH transcriptional regulator